MATNIAGRIYRVNATPTSTTNEVQNDEIITFPAFGIQSFDVDTFDYININLASSNLRIIVTDEHASDSVLFASNPIFLHQASLNTATRTMYVNDLGDDQHLQDGIGMSGISVNGTFNGHIREPNEETVLSIIVPACIVNEPSRIFEMMSIHLGSGSLEVIDLPKVRPSVLLPIM